ncbi:hypothetical protein SPSYN_01206 [Sporotomaculum syntrophicum]|uniref:LarC family nickel insertion protein n=1 Tax=Sporotomaculum syntrophicum TaxID=182264 RepID=A0A9D2WQ47_9FIRM|nr:LarC family nickel insertion protein [Sporotomaculum syntrophicum]KAF1085070.1 hypothetical protein SPSYN_01206 [Sporotomaculum syntrophicum]
MSGDGEPMTVAHFNCRYGFSPGAALAALIGAGADVEEMNSRLADLKLVPGRLSAFTGCSGHGLLYTGVKVQPLAGEQYPAEGLVKELKARGLDAGALERFAQVMEQLSSYYQARLAGPVYLSDKLLVEILGTVLALESLQAAKLFVAPLPLDSAGGGLSGQSFNVLALLNGFVVGPAAGQATIITPTGAAILKGLAKPDLQMPGLILRATGCGAELAEGGKTGGKPGVNLAEPIFKALVNVVLGEPVSGNVQAGKISEEVLLMETAIDDMNPEYYPYLMARLLEAGALDVYLKHIIMKKGRPGVMLVVVAREDRQESLLQIIFSETSTLGVRLRTERRRCLHRELITVQTSYGAVRVKLAREEPGMRPLRCSPEFEDCLTRARDQQVPLQNVYRAALLAAESWLEKQP